MSGAMLATAALGQVSVPLFVSLIGVNLKWS